MPQGDHIPIVGIGASAGGVEALEGLFRAIPADSGLAYVVVTHLGSGHMRFKTRHFCGNSGRMEDFQRSAGGKSTYPGKTLSSRSDRT